MHTYAERKCTNMKALKKRKQKLKNNTPVSQQINKRDDCHLTQTRGGILSQKLKIVVRNNPLLRHFDKFVYTGNLKISQSLAVRFDV